MSATTFERDSSAARGYDRRWRKARAAFLRKNPLCVMCRAEGKTREAQVVDHIIPHKGDRKLFWDRSNWQGLCPRRTTREPSRLLSGAATAGR